MRNGLSLAENLPLNGSTPRCDVQRSLNSVHLAREWAWFPGDGDEAYDELGAGRHLDLADSPTFLLWIENARPGADPRNR